MDRRQAEKVGRGERAADRKLTTNGVPDRPLPKVWNGSGRVVRDNGKDKK